MPQQFIVLPMFALVLLTATVLGVLFRRRVASVQAGSVPAAYYKVYEGSVEPAQVRQTSRHFVNLFESPVLFYAACLTALAVGHASAPMQLLAWAYVACRVVHAIVHLGNNRLRPRIGVYFFSWLVLLIMWGYLALQVIQAS